MPGTLFVVATPIGNLEDITLRALRVLREVAVIAAEDTRHTARLLARHAIATPTTSLHEHNEAAKSASLVERLKRGEHIAVVSDAGTPAISDPGGRLIRDAIDAGVRVEPIPGPSAVLTFLSAAGLPMDTFCFLGFPPTRSKDRKEWFNRLDDHAGAVVFFEAPHRIRATLEELRQKIGDVQVVVGRELTKMHEELVRRPISGVLEQLSTPKGEFVVGLIIGQTTETEPETRPCPKDILIEYGHIANTKRMSRRQVIAELSRRHGVPANDLYRMLEEAKKSGE